MSTLVGDRGANFNCVVGVTNTFDGIFITFEVL